MEAHLQKSLLKYEFQEIADVSAEDNQAFLAAAKKALEGGQSQLLKSIILDDKNQGFIFSVGWDLLSVVGTFLSEKNDEAETNVDCTTIIERIAEVGKTKEIFIGLLEQLDRFLDSAVCRLFFRPLQIVLRKFGSSKSLYMEQALDQLHACIEGIPLPQYDGLDMKQKRLLIQDEDYQQLEETCVDLVEFVAPFVFEIQETVSRVDEDELQDRKGFREALSARKEIQRYLIRLLEYPLVFVEVEFDTLLDQTHNEEEPSKPVYESGFSTCAKQILSYLTDMRCSMASLLSYIPDSSEQEESAPAASAEADEVQDGQRHLSMLGLSNLVYLVHSVRLPEARVPSVYSADYLFALHKIHVATLLQKREEPTLSKGLELLLTLAKQVEDLTLSSQLLIDDIYLNIPKTLIRIMVTHTSETLRKQAVCVLPVYIDKFDWKGRYRLLTVLLESSEHSGVKGFLIGRIKEYVHITLQSNLSNPWFVGGHLRQIYPAIFHLPNGSETDLLEESDKIIAALNFLRYLLLRDSQEVDATGIWSVLEQTDKGYLSELITGLELSRMHYKQRADELLDEKKRAKKAKEAETLSVSVGGQEIGRMPFEQQMQVLTSAQFTFDLMQSLLGRVNEIISAESRR